MATDAELQGDRNTWGTARELGKKLNFPVGPYEVTVPTPEQMNAVLPYIMDRMARFAAEKYFCENAELTLAHVLGINVPRWGFPDSSGFNTKTGRDWEGYNHEGYDSAGYNREGYDYRGFDKHGFNKEGFDRRGFNKEGFNVEGRDRDGRTRDEAAQSLINGWSKDHLQAIKAQLAAMGLAAQQAEAEIAATTVAAEETVEVLKATPKKAVAKKATAKKAAPKRLVAPNGTRIATI